jgi:hypothetical protein
VYAEQIKVTFTIHKVISAVDIDAARALFSDYAHWLQADHQISLQFQGIDAELASLPGKYAPPRGQIYLAKDTDGHAVGWLSDRLKGLSAR